MTDMNKLSNSERATIIRGLVEGNSIASLVRMTGIAKTTILRLIVQFADVCQQFHDEKVKGLTSRRVQMDEVWAFVGSKENNTDPAKKAELKWGDAWTWTAIDADSKLMISWLIGPRNANSAFEIMEDVASRLTHRIQLTTDGLHAYWSAAASSFDCRVDYAQLVKLYGKEAGETGRYSPPKCIGVEVKPRIGDPDPKHISTSYIERSNLTVRMGMRRYTRLTNGHSKKFQNHVAMTTIFLTIYNWCRIHQTLKVTPAMQAGLTTELLDIEDLIGLLK
jgi:IS1 family transposase